MADQTYNLAQTGAEVQAIINDANGVKGAGATTSLTTDYIMLKDTSGAYHKIQKSSFTEAVRNTLASLLVNNDKGTTISQIAAIASGDFGSVTPANLASVLGALTFIIDNSHPDASGDFNNYTTTGIFTINTFSAPLENSPTDGMVGLMFVFGFKGRSNSIAMQVIISIRSIRVYFRECRTDSGWGDWKSIVMS